MGISMCEGVGLGLKFKRESGWDSSLRGSQ